MADESVNQGSSANDSTSPAPWEAAHAAMQTSLATLIAAQANTQRNLEDMQVTTQRNLEGMQTQMRDLMNLFQAQAIAQPTQVILNPTPSVTTDAPPPPIVSAPPPPIVSAPPPPLQSACTPQFPTIPAPTDDRGSHMSLVGSCDDDESGDVVHITLEDIDDDARNNVNECIAESAVDDSLLPLEPLLLTPEAQIEPRETIVQAHFSNVGQVCTFVNFMDSLTNILSMALDDKMMLPTISRPLPDEAQGQNFFSSTHLSLFMSVESHADLRSNLSQPGEIDPDGSSSLSTHARPDSKPPWRAKAMTKFGSIEA